MVIKNCVYKGCRNDSRYKDREYMDGIFFIRFPNIKSNIEKCKRWISACARPEFLTLEALKKRMFICSFHFVGGAGPTEENPDPIPFHDYCIDDTHETCKIEIPSKEPREETELIKEPSLTFEKRSVSIDESSLILEVAEPIDEPSSVVVEPALSKIEPVLTVTDLSRDTEPSLMEEQPCLGGAANKFQFDHLLSSIATDTMGHENVYTRILHSTKCEGLVKNETNPSCKNCNCKGFKRAQLAKQKRAKLKELNTLIIATTCGNNPGEENYDEIITADDSNNSSVSPGEMVPAEDHDECLRLEIMQLHTQLENERLEFRKYVEENTKTLNEKDEIIANQNEEIRRLKELNMKLQIMESNRVQIDKANSEVLASSLGNNSYSTNDQDQSDVVSMAAQIKMEILDSNESTIDNYQDGNSDLSAASCFSQDEVILPTTEYLMDCQIQNAAPKLPTDNNLQTEEAPPNLSKSSFNLKTEYGNQPVLNGEEAASLRCKDEMPTSSESALVMVKMEDDEIANNSKRKKSELLKCDRCSFVTNWASNLKTHKVTHMALGDRLFKCDECKYSAFNKKHLLAHKMIHTDGPFICNECGYATTRTLNLYQHKKIHIKRQESNSSTNQNTLLNNHDEIGLNTGDQQLKCDQCDFVTNQEVDLYYHRTVHTHTDYLRFKCDKCDYASNQKTKLNTHKRVHMRDLPFKCEKCDFASVKKMYLDKHKKSHAKDQMKSVKINTDLGFPNFKCEKCDFASVKKMYLDMHKKIHAKDQMKSVKINTDLGFPPFKCDECDYASFEISILKMHKNIHSGERLFKCAVNSECSPDKM